MTLDELIVFIESMGATVTEAEDGTFTVQMGGDAYQGMTRDDLLEMAVDNLFPGQTWPPTKKEAGKVVPDETEYRQIIGVLRARAQEAIKGQEQPLPAGSPPTQTRTDGVYAYNPKTGKYDIFRGKEEQGQASVVTLDGQRFIQQPNGNVTQFPGQERRSLDDMLIDALEAGDMAEQERVLNLMDRVEALRNRPRPMNDQEIFEFLAPIAQNPQHFEELLRAFKQDVGQQVPMVSMPQEQGAGQQAQVGVPGGLALLPGETAAEYGARTGQGGVPTEEEETGIRVPQATPEALARVQADAALVERTGSFDPDRPAFGRLGPAGSAPGMRTEDEEGWLNWFLGTRDPAAARGVGVPAAAQERFGQLSAKSPYRATAEQQRQPRPPRVGGQGVVKQEPAFGGTEEQGAGFSPIPTGNILQEKFTRAWNERRQELFKRRRAPQVMFR